jgi:hypothetical protein
MDYRGSSRSKALNRLSHPRPADFLRFTATAANMHVQVYSVLHDLRLRHFEERNRRTYSARILDVSSASHSSGGTPTAANHSGQLAKPSGGDASTYPSARFQMAASVAGWAQSIVTVHLTLIGTAFSEIYPASAKQPFRAFSASAV